MCLIENKSSFHFIKVGTRIKIFPWFQTQKWDMKSSTITTHYCGWMDNIHVFMIDIPFTVAIAKWPTGLLLVVRIEFRSVAWYLLYHVWSWSWLYPSYQKYWTSFTCAAFFSKSHDSKNGKTESDSAPTTSHIK